MKPQCNTSADCLRELARVMEQFGIYDPETAIKSEYVTRRKDGVYLLRRIGALYDPAYWQFAIAEVEGKPVFIGDELYDTREAGNYKLVAGEYVNGFICEAGYSEKGHGRSASIGCLSWNPPKPAHVMVKLPWFVVAQYASCEGSYAPFRDDIRLACKAALEKLK